MNKRWILFIILIIAMYYLYCTEGFEDAKDTVITATPASKDDVKNVLKNYAITALSN
jgi:hypothetical protein